MVPGWTFLEGAHENNNLYEGASDPALPPQPPNSCQALQPNRLPVDHVLLAEFPREAAGADSEAWVESFDQS